MGRKLVVFSGLGIFCLALGVTIWTRPVHSLVAYTSNKAQKITPTQIFDINFSDDAQKVIDTILRAKQVDLEAAYTFDISILATVYIDDPRGGELKSEALALIKEIRQDPTIQKDQVGMLALNQVVVERRKRAYETYIAELWAKQADGTISDEEKYILDLETNGLPTSTPEAERPEVTPTPFCNPYLQLSTMTPSSVYPAPNSLTLPSPTPDLEPALPYCEPTPIPPEPQITRVLHRGPNPDLLPQESFDIGLQSITIEGDIARAVVSKSGITTELVLVKVDEQWFIAGSKILKYAP